MLYPSCICFYKTLERTLTMLKRCLILLGFCCINSEGWASDRSDDTISILQSHQTLINLYKRDLDIYRSHAQELKENPEKRDLYSSEQEEIQEEIFRQKKTIDNFSIKSLSHSTQIQLRDKIEELWKDFYKSTYHFKEEHIDFLKKAYPRTSLYEIYAEALPIVIIRLSCYYREIPKGDFNYINVIMPDKKLLSAPFIFRRPINPEGERLSLSDRYKIKMTDLNKQILFYAIKKNERNEIEKFSGTSSEQLTIDHVLRLNSDGVVLSAQGIRFYMNKENQFIRSMGKFLK